MLVVGVVVVVVVVVVSVDPAAAPQPLDRDDVVVVTTKFAIYATLLATLSPGDEVLLPDPTYLFEQPIQLVGGRPVYVPLRPDFSLDADALRAAVTPRTRALILVSPAMAAAVFQESVAAFSFDDLEPWDAWWLLTTAGSAANASPGAAADLYERILTVASAPGYGEKSKSSVTAILSGRVR